MKRTCVLRDVRGIKQYIPIEDAVALVAGEKVFSGDFTVGTEKDGPSGSHVRTVCTPAGRLLELSITTCVLREVAPGDSQYVPTAEVPSVVPGERLFVGVFTGRLENLGPYKSHQRTVCLPAGYCRETVAERKAA